MKRLNRHTFVNVPSGCYADGEASLPVRMELANGPVLVSLVGYSLAYSTLDSGISPTSGIYAKLTQDFAGVGGDVNFIRTTFDARTYYEVLSDVVGVFRVQGGHVPAGAARTCACWITSRWDRIWSAASNRPDRPARFDGGHQQ